MSILTYLKRYLFIHKGLLVVCIYCGGSFLFGMAPQLTAVVNKSRVLVGEKITLSLTLKTTLRDYQLPILKGRLGAFQIKDYHLVKVPLSKEESLQWNVQTIAYTLVGYEVGKKTIPPIKFDYGTGRVRTEPIEIQVDSVLLGGNQNLEPLKPNLMTDGNIYWWVYPGVVFLIILLGYFIKLTIMYIWKQRYSPYYKVAEIQLEKLNKDVINQGFTKVNYFKLYQTIKRFYTEYVGEPNILSMTSKQIAEYSEYHSKHIDFFSKFFSCADTVKFQVSDPNPSLFREQIKEFMTIVEKVKKEIEANKDSKDRLKSFLNMS